MKPSVKLDTTRLTSAIKEVSKNTKVSLEKAVKDASILFLQSAARATPPQEGKATFNKRTNFREVIALKDKKTDKVRYKVPFRTLKRKGRKFFESLAEAISFSRVKWRGIGRAGWWAGLIALGQNVANQPGTKEVALSAKRWGTGYFEKQAYLPQFTVVNHTDTIQHDFKMIIAAKALGRASRRLLASIKNMNKKNVEKFK
jgi:hypothetical protein